MNVYKHLISDYIVKDSKTIPFSSSKNIYHVFYTIQMQISSNEIPYMMFLLKRSNNSLTFPSTKVNSYTKFKKQQKTIHKSIISFINKYQTNLKITPRNIDEKGYIVDECKDDNNVFIFSSIDNIETIYEYTETSGYYWVTIDELLNKREAHYPIDNTILDVFYKNDNIFRLFTIILDKISIPNIININLKNKNMLVALNNYDEEKEMFFIENQVSIKDVPYSKMKNIIRGILFLKNNDKYFIEDNKIYFTNRELFTIISIFK